MSGNPDIENLPTPPMPPRETMPFTSTQGLIALQYDMWLNGVKVKNNLVPEEFDYIELTYITSGNGQGEIETATYKTGGASGITVALLTLTYNSDNELLTVTRT